MKKDTEKIMVEEWKITISDGVLASVHGFGREITEFFIPEYDIAFNIDGAELRANVFRTTRSERYERSTEDNRINYFNTPAPIKVGERFVDQKFIDFLMEYIRLKDGLFGECSKTIIEGSIDEHDSD